MEDRYWKLKGKNPYLTVVGSKEFEEINKDVKKVTKKIAEHNQKAILTLTQWWAEWWAMGLRMSLRDKDKDKDKD